MRRAIAWLLAVLEDARWSVWAFKQTRRTKDARKVWRSRRYLRAHDARMVRQMAAAGVLR